MSRIIEMIPLQCNIILKFQISIFKIRIDAKPGILLLVWQRAAIGFLMLPSTAAALSFAVFKG
jgi:hypothetical protein